jgi:A/G-specific adenine glycosylase
MMPARYVDAVEDLLLAWYAEHGRDLPWRTLRDPYAILVSEVMSQQYGIEIVYLPAMQGFSD